jgi:MoxR-like ATPase
MPAEPTAARFRLPIYKGPDRAGDSLPKPPGPLRFEALPRKGLDDPSRYWPHPEVMAAVNTALLLGLPLIVTGEPGCGKTQLGEAIAYALGLSHERFETKSTSQARDVLYVYDVVGRFHAKEAGLGSAEADARHFIDYTALGKAILLAHEAADIGHLLPTGAGSFRHPGAPVRSVVVIDEVDKASRDFPNDLLTEIDRMYFRVPELGAEGIRGTPGAGGRDKEIPPSLRPIVIFTSNSEKKLPDAFLRRCVFVHMPEPRREELAAIVAARLADAAVAVGFSPEAVERSPLVDDAISLYMHLRRPNAGLAKRPGLAELLNFLHALVGHGADPAKGLAGEQAPLAVAALVTLCKTVEDRARTVPSGPALADGLFRAWQRERTEPRT